MSNWTGTLELDMENRHGRTVARNVFFQGSLKVMRPVYLAGGTYPCYYLLNPGGGFLDGDTYHMKISLDANAHLTLTTQSSTKVYKTPENEVYQESEFQLGEDSYLEYLPDALIAYKDARYYQKNIVHMEKGASLFYADILTPGWSPEGTAFSYDRVRLKNEIYMDGRLAAYDHVKLEPSSQDMSQLGFMEGYTHLGSCIVVGDNTTEELIDRLYHVIKEEEGDFAFGISKLAIKGFTIRIMANYTQVIEHIISVSHCLINKEWFDLEPSFLRKY